MQPLGESTVRPADNEVRQNLRMDYEQTLEQFAMLADIRFKLLGFVPTLAALAVGLLSEDKVSSSTALAVGALGFVMTLAILIYEVRNSQLYDAIIHRAKFLEGQLGLPLSTPDAKRGGAFNERPGRSLKLFGMFSIWHDRGLSLAYGAAIGGWVFIIASNVLALAGRQDLTLAAFTGVICGTLFAWEIVRLSGKNRPKPLAVSFSTVSGSRSLKDRRPALLQVQLLAIILASIAAIVANSLFYFLLKVILGVEFVAPEQFPPPEVSPLPVFDVILFSAIFSIGASVVFFIVANIANEPAPLFIKISFIVLLASCYLPLRIPTPPVPMATKFSLVGMHILGAAVLVPLLVWFGLSTFERRNFMLIRIWRVKVKQERIDELEKFAHTVSLPMFKGQKGCLGVMFTRQGNDCATISYWKDQASIEKMNSSPAYVETVEKIEASGMLDGGHSVEVFQGFDGYLVLDGLVDGTRSVQP